MDGRLLRACQLLMEFAAAQLEQAAPDPLTAHSGQRTEDNKQLKPNGAPRPVEEPVTVYGDNPNFDPARFAELRRGQADPVVMPYEDAAAAAVRSYEGMTTEPPPMYTEPVRLPFAAPPGPRVNGTPYPGPGANNTPCAVPPAPAAGGRAFEGPPAVMPGERPDGPAATLTMRDISDHFERDARRYDSMR